MCSTIMRARIFLFRKAYFVVDVTPSCSRTLKQTTTVYSYLLRLSFSSAFYVGVSRFIILMLCRKF